jgi:transcriptional regulator with XRE-family HTH domain
MMSHANIGRIEKGEQPYNEEFLEAAADALQCTVTDLLTVDPRIDDAVAELNSILRAASKGDQQRALDIVRAMLKTGTDG